MMGIQDVAGMALLVGSVLTTGFLLMVFLPKVPLKPVSARNTRLDRMVFSTVNFLDWLVLFYAR